MYRHGPSKCRSSFKRLFQLKAGGRAVSKCISAGFQIKAGSNKHTNLV